jgi:agmatine deiminase
MKKPLLITSIVILIIAIILCAIYFLSNDDEEMNNNSSNSSTSSTSTDSNSSTSTSSSEIENAAAYSIPAESEEHEGTWLIWPHKYTYGQEYQEELENIWISMTNALISGEKVHIIAYNEEEKARITGVLEDYEMDMEQIDFTIAESNDVWVRDTGPIFAFDEKDDLTILNFGFDGWGKKTAYEKDDDIPLRVAEARDINIENFPDIVLEGGAMELDGAGTFMACKSSVISKNRNAGLSQEELEEFLQQNLGITNFIWLEGVTNEDITDAHIDGIARFYDKNTLLTVPEDDFYDLYENIPEEDYDVLQSAKNADGEKYDIVEIPLTKNNVSGLDYKGSYLNFYVGNDVVLLPVYGDENDGKAIEILQELYPDRDVAPIDVTPLYKYGGMLHCVTQQQPASR